MAYGNTVWTTLERWSPRAFLAAGGLFALPVIASGVDALTGTEIVFSPAAIFTFLLVVFVGLLGLYPRLAEQNDRLANGCVGLLAVTATTTVPAIGVFTRLTGYPFGEATALTIVVSVAVGSTLTVATFGVATLRTGTHSRLVSGFLLVMAASLSFMVATMVLYGHSGPEWVSTAVNGLVATSLGGIGFVLRTRYLPTETPDATDSATAS